MRYVRIISWRYDGRRLHGYVVGHELFNNWEYIHTSSVQTIDENVGYAVTRNTTYILGEKAGGQ